MTEDLYMEQLLRELEEKGLIIRRGKMADGREQVYLLNPVALPETDCRQCPQLRLEAEVI